LFENSARSALDAFFKKKAWEGLQALAMQSLSNTAALLR